MWIEGDHVHHQLRQIYMQKQRLTADHKY